MITNLLLARNHVNEGLRRESGVLLLALAVLAGCSSHLEQGGDALDDGRYAEARREARAGLQDEPEDPELLILMARALYGLEDFTGAVRFAEHALGVGGLGARERGRARAVAGRAHARLNDLELAAGHLAVAFQLGAVENDPGLRRNLLDGGLLALEGGRYGHAFDLLRLVAQLNLAADAREGVAEVQPYLLRAASLRARELGRMGEPDQALDLLDSVLAEHPAMSRLLLEKASVLARTGREDDAEAAFETYIDRAPDPIDAEVAVGDALAAIQEWDWAVRHYMGATERGPTTHSAHVGLISALLATGRLDDARVASEAYVAAMPAAGSAGTAQAYLAIVDAWLPVRASEATDWLGRGNDAVHDVRLATRLASSLTRRGAADQAADVLRGFVTLSDDPGYAAEALGDWYLEQGRLTLAIEWLEEAVRHRPQDAPLLLNLAETYRSAGWEFEMAAVLRAFVEAHNGAGRARRQAAALLEEAERWPDVVEFLTPVQAEHPTDAGLLVRLGRALYLSGAPEREQALYDETWAVATDPDALAVHLGRALADRGNHSEAVLWFERAVHADSVRADALLGLGQSHQLLNDPTEMWAAYDAFVAEADDPIAAGWEVLERFEGRRYAHLARALLERLIEREPDREDLRFAHIERLLELRDDAALEDAAVALVSRADDPRRVAGHLVWTLRFRPVLARRAIDTLLAQQPRLPGVELAAARLYVDLASDPSLSSPARRANRGQAWSRLAAFLDAGPTDSAEVIAAGDLAVSGRLWDVAARAFLLARELGAPVAPYRRELSEALVRTGQEVSLATELLRDDIGTHTDPPRRALEAVELLAEAELIDSAVALTYHSLALAQDDADARPIFEAAGRLLVDAGRVEELVELADTFVSLADDQFSAVHSAARLLVQGRQDELGREYYALALALVPGDRSTLEALARLPATSEQSLEGDAQVRDLIEDGPSPWRAWWHYAITLFDAGAVERAWQAIEAAVAAGGTDLELAIDRGRIAAARGDLELARAAFQEALMRARELRYARRATIAGQAAEALNAAGAPDAAEAMLMDVLGDDETVREVALFAARLAFQRGAVERGRQLTEAFIEAGGRPDLAIAVELEFGLPEVAMDRLGRLVFEGHANAAGLALERFAPEVVAHRDVATLETWIDELAFRGAVSDDLLDALLVEQLRSGHTLAAIGTLARLTKSDPVRELQLVPLLAAEGDTAGMTNALRRYFARAPLAVEEWDRVMGTLLSAAAVGGGEAVDAALATLRVEWVSPGPAALWVEWRAAHGHHDEALAALASLPIETAPALAGRALIALARHGAGDLARVTAEHWVAHARAADDELLAAATVLSLTGGDAEGAIRHYREMAGDQTEALFRLGERAVQSGDAGLAWSALSGVLGEGRHPTDRRRAATLLLRAAAAAGDQRVAEDTIAALSRGGAPRRAHLHVARVAFDLGHWTRASDQLAAAEAYATLDDGSLRLLVECLFRWGDTNAVLARLGEVSRSQLGDVEPTALAGAMTRIAEQPPALAEVRPRTTSDWALLSDGRLALSIGGLEWGGLSALETRWPALRSYPAALAEVGTLASLLVEAGDTNAAVLAYEDAQRFIDDPAARLSLAVHGMSQGGVELEAAGLAAWSQVTTRRPGAARDAGLIIGMADRHLDLWVVRNTIPVHTSYLAWLVALDASVGATE